MFRNIYRAMRASRLAQAGVALVVLGAGVQALDELGSVDLASLPYVGKYAAVILAIAGVLKILMRIAMALVGIYNTSEAPKA